MLSDENLRNAFLALNEGEGKDYIDANNIKKFIFHDADIQDDILNEYLEQFGMTKDEKMNFEQFCDILRKNKKLNEKCEDDIKEESIDQICENDKKIDDLINIKNASYIDSSESSSSSSSINEEEESEENKNNVNSK